MTIQEDLAVFDAETTTVEFVNPSGSGWGTTINMQNELSLVKPLVSIQYNEKGVLFNGLSGKRLFVVWERIGFLRHTPPVLPENPES